MKGKREREKAFNAGESPNVLADDEEPLVMPIEDSIDLHTFRPGEVRHLLNDYLEAASAKGFEEVLIIHGKGSGILRASVHAILAKHPLVKSFRQSDTLGGGGWGATVAVLRPNPEHAPPIAE